MEAERMRTRPGGDAFRITFRREAQMGLCSEMMKTGVQQPEWSGVLQIVAHKGLACVLPNLCALYRGLDSSLSGCET